MEREPASPLLRGGCQLSGAEGRIAFSRIRSVLPRVPHRDVPQLPAVRRLFLERRRMRAHAAPPRHTATRELVGSLPVHRGTMAGRRYLISSLYACASRRCTRPDTPPLWRTTTAHILTTRGDLNAAYVCWFVAVCCSTPHLSVYRGRRQDVMAGTRACVPLLHAPPSAPAGISLTSGW